MCRLWPGAQARCCASTFDVCVPLRSADPSTVDSSLTTLTYSLTRTHLIYALYFSLPARPVSDPGLTVVGLRSQLAHTRHST